MGYGLMNPPPSTLPRLIYYLLDDESMMKTNETPPTSAAHLCVLSISGDDTVPDSMGGRNLGRMRNRFTRFVIQLIARALREHTPVCSVQRMTRTRIIWTSSI